MTRPSRPRLRPRLTPLEDRLVPATFTVDLLADTVAADGKTSFREAVSAANAAVGADVIAFDPAFAGATISLGATGLFFGESTTVQGFPDNPLTVTGDFPAKSLLKDVLLFDAPATATVTGLKVVNTSAAGGNGIVNRGTLTLTKVTVDGVVAGSGLQNTGTATLANCVVTNCINPGDPGGGGIANNGSLTLTDSRVSNNKATSTTTGVGGGILSAGPRLDLVNTVVSGNTAAVAGGGIAIVGGTVTVTAGSKITGNTAQIGGGFGVVGSSSGASVTAPTVTISDAVIDGNTAVTAAGVAVAADTAAASPTVTLTNVTLSNNAAELNATGTVSISVPASGTTLTFAAPRGFGGGLVIGRGKVTATGGTTTGNKATVGGGIGILAGTLSLTDATISTNTATTGGGMAIVGAAAEAPAATFTRVTFTSNTAASGATVTLDLSTPGSPLPVIARGAGGALYTAAAAVTVTDSSFTKGTATQAAGIAVLSGTVGLSRVTVSENSSTADAGGVGIAGGTVTLTNATVDGNKAAQAGGVGVSGGTVTVANSTVTANAATRTAGGIGVTAGTVAVRSSIVALNTAPTDADVGGTVTSGGGNLIGTAGSSTAFGAADQVGTTAAPLNPRLGPLANNGGPTLTRLPLSGSPAADKGTATGAPATDQRGLPRPSGAGIDAGAVERQPGDPTTPAGSGTLPRTFAAGTDAGGAARVRAFDQTGKEQFALTPFGETFTGGVRIARADLTGDGTDDLIVGSGPGTSAAVKVIDGATQKVLFDVLAFEASFVGGVYVAAGDVTGDGVADFVVTPDEGGGPRCDVYSGAGFGKVASFFGIDDPNFRGGARAAIADLTGDGTGDLLVAAGFGGGPRLAGFNGKSLGGTPSRVFGDFFAFEQTLRNGVFITAGDIDGDGNADVIAGGGPGGGPRVFALSGAGLIDGNREVPLANFFGGDDSGRGGIRLAVKDLDGDAKADLVVGAGAGAGSRVTAYFGKDIAPAGTPAKAFDFDAYAGFTGGVFVG